MATLKARIKIRSATAAQWASANPVLLAGEIVLETDTKIIRVGDGTTAFNLLPQIKSQALLDAIYQPKDATLTSLAGLGSAAGKFAYTTGIDTWAEASITAAGRALLDDADTAAQRLTLGIGMFPGTAAATITSWDTIAESGIYMGNALATAPDATNWFIGWHLQHNSLYAVQEVCSFNIGNVNNTASYMRFKQGGTWTAWFRRYVSSPDILGIVSGIAIGSGQTAQNVTASRVAGTSYQNTTGKPIAVSVVADGSAGTPAKLQLSSDGATWVDFSGFGETAWGHMFAIVPNGHYYRAYGGDGIKGWAELR